MSLIVFQLVDQVVPIKNDPILDFVALGDFVSLSGVGKSFVEVILVETYQRAIG